jgi:hypothetical protein
MFAFGLNLFASVQEGRAKGQGSVNQGKLVFLTAAQSPGLFPAQGSVLVGTKLRKAA